MANYGCEPEIQSTNLQLRSMCFSECNKQELTCPGMEVQHRSDDMTPSYSWPRGFRTLVSLIMFLAALGYTGSGFIVLQHVWS